MSKTKSNETLVKEAAERAELNAALEALATTKLFDSLPYFVVKTVKNPKEGTPTQYVRADIKSLITSLSPIIGAAMHKSFDDDDYTTDDILAVRTAIVLLSKVLNIVRPTFDDFVDANRNPAKMNVKRLRNKTVKEESADKLAIFNLDI